jgi:catechol 2,3-dioxygenase-like lactoylglutathione lyase family enzyme
VLSCVLSPGAVLRRPGLGFGSLAGMDMLTGLNHLTLAVGDLDRSLAFYSGLLGFSIRMRAPSSAYLEAGSLWLALVVDPAVRRGPLPEYSHAAFSISPSELPVLAQRLINDGIACWQGAERSDSFYFLDPDGHKLELHSGDLRCRLAARAALCDPEVTIYDSSHDSA